jgi:hypothetical protein
MALSSRNSVSHLRARSQRRQPPPAGDSKYGTRAPAAGWYLKWAATTPEEERVWKKFKEDAMSRFEATNYQGRYVKNCVNSSKIATLKNTTASSRN